MIDPDKFADALEAGALHLQEQSQDISKMLAEKASGHWSDADPVVIRIQLMFQALYQDHAHALRIMASKLRE